MRPSITKMNARHRGPTDTETYTNVFNELKHDILYLFSTSVGRWIKVNELDQYVQGHKDQIVNNLNHVIDDSRKITQSTTIPITTLRASYNNVNVMEKELNLIESELIKWSIL